MQLYEIIIYGYQRVTTYYYSLVVVDTPPKPTFKALRDAPFMYWRILRLHPQNGHMYARYWTLQSIKLSDPGNHIWLTKLMDLL